MKLPRPYANLNQRNRALSAIVHRKNLIAICEATSTTSCSWLCGKSLLGGIALQNIWPQIFSATWIIFNGGQERTLRATCCQSLWAATNFNNGYLPVSLRANTGR